MKNSNKIKKITCVAIVIALITSLMSLSYANTNANAKVSANVNTSLNASEPVVVLNWGDLQNAVATASGATTIELANDISTTATLTIPETAEITLTGNYSLILTGNVPVITVNGNFTLDGPTITRTNLITANGRGVLVNSGGILTMESGAISGHSIQAGSGGGVAVGGTFIMRGGEISDNATWNSGGALHVSGIFTMYGGEIRENHAGGDGGGLYVAPGGSVTQRGGKINENTSGRDAGGVYLFTGEFTMYGGEINGNIGGNWRGGGVAMDFSSKFTMHGGEINGNSGARSGGGVFASTSSEFIMNGGVISGNKSSISGGGLYIGNIANIQGGRICCNIAGSNGGGIFAWSYTALTVSSDVIFSGNTANSAHDYSLNANYPNPIPAVESGGGAGGSAANIQWANVSIGGTHVLNNYDINYSGHLITTQLVTLNPNTGVFDCANQLPTRLIINGSATLNNVEIYYNILFYENGNLLNKPLPRPTKVGYDFGGWFDTWENADGTDQTGRVLITDSVTSDAERTLWARWIRPIPGGNGNGGNGGTELPTQPQAPTPTLSREAYLIGFDDGLIRPNANITRAEVATIFFRLLTDEQRADYWTQQNPFSDVVLGNWFNNAISTMTNAGVFTGFPDNSFAPNHNITRAEMATIIVRFMDVSDESAGRYLLTNYFNDILNHWASEYINTVAAKDWVRGSYGLGGAFYPDRFITRAEVVAMVNRIFGRLQERTVDLLPDMQTWPDNRNVDAWYYFYIQSATNSYTFQWRGANNTFERWLTIIPPRNWVELERQTATGQTATE